MAENHWGDTISENWIVTNDARSVAYDPRYFETFSNKGLKAYARQLEQRIGSAIGTGIDMTSVRNTLAQINDTIALRRLAKQRNKEEAEAERAIANEAIEQEA